MSDNSAIEWTDATWNPVTGCDEVSPGCDHCYAKTLAERFRGAPGHYFEQGFDVVLRPDKLGLPLKWRKPKKVFVNSMSDLFHKDVPDDYIARVFAVMAATPQHTYQILTKRHGRMRSLLGRQEFIDAVWYARAELTGEDIDAPATWWPGWPLPNAWLGVSVEDQQRADLRIPALLMTPAAVRFLSCEPLLGPVDLTRVAFTAGGGSHLDVVHGRHGVPDVWSTGAQRVDWVIAGGESGRGARPMHPDWVRSLRDQCVSGGVPFHFKQWGEWAPRCTLALCGHTCSCDGVNASHPAEPLRVGKKRAGRELDGRTWDEFPERSA